MLPSTKEEVAKVSIMLGVIAASASSSMLEPNEIDPSEDDDEIFFLLCGFVAYIRF